MNKIAPAIIIVLILMSARATLAFSEVADSWLTTPLSSKEDVFSEV